MGFFERPPRDGEQPPRLLLATSYLRSSGAMLFDAAGRVAYNRSVRRLAATAAVTLAAASPALAAGWRVIGHATQSGSFLVAGASGHAARPTKIEVTVTSSPRAGVGGNTLVVCDGRTVHGHVHGKTPIVRMLRLPVARPGACSVVVNVTYARHGTVSVAILAR